MRSSGVSTTSSARGPVSPSLFPGGMMSWPNGGPVDNARLYALGRLLFAIALITITLILLALLHVPLLALSRTVDVLRAL